jgi:hypothetical protein
MGGQSHHKSETDKSVRLINVMNLPLNPRVWLDLIRPLPTGRGMVIVTGMPKSGTTAIAKLLGFTTGQKVCSDPFYRLSRMKIDFRDKLFDNQLSLNTLWRRHRRVFSGTIIKDPNFVLLLPQIRKMLPDAQIVFIIRDPRDNIRSILNRLGLPGKPQDSDLDLADLPIGWRNLIRGKSPHIPGKEYVEVLARRWRMAAEVLQRYREFCVVIRYEDFTNNKSAAIFNLAGQLGYSELQKIDHLVDVQYQPKGDAAVLWDEFFGKTQLTIIEQVTAPLLGHFGYTTHTCDS